jgi:undecaprenyl-diphosphatase
MKYNYLISCIRSQFIFLIPLFIILIIIHIITKGNPEEYFINIRFNKNVIYYIFYYVNNYFTYLIYFIYIYLIFKSYKNKSYTLLNFVICFIVGQLIFSLLAVHILKRSLGVPRPNTGEADLHFFTGQSRYHSMPSGHTAEVTVSCGSLALFGGGCLRALLWGLVPALVGFGRIFAGMHHSLDVVAGAILGSLGSLAVIWGHMTPGFGLAWRRRLQAAIPGFMPGDQTEGSANGPSLTSEERLALPLNIKEH